jgi:hypothetical protein
MKRAVTILSAAALTFAIAGPVRAQHITTNAVATANNYFDSHPDIAHKLAKDPSLIDNQQFVDNHPGMREYLHDHPNVKHEFKAHPNRFMKHERRFEKHHD